MKSHKLARYVAPPPPPKPTCNACKAYAPEVIVPLGEGAIELCWLCAHHHVDHGVPLSECPTSERCEHAPHEIYPSRKPDALIAKAENRAQAIEQLQATGMPRQEAKALTYTMVHGMGPSKLAAESAWRSRNGTVRHDPVGGTYISSPVTKGDAERAARELRTVPSENRVFLRDEDVPAWRSRQGRAAGMLGASYPRPRKAK